MRQSQIFGRTKKESPKDETSLNAQYLIRGGFVDKNMSGVYSYLPLGWRVLEKIKNIIREEINAIGGQEVYLPALASEDNYKQTKRDEAMGDVLFSVSGLNNDSKMYLNPTHEEIITPLVKQFVHSYRDLPVYVYQIQDKFRNEARAKSGLLRGREFSMKDLYSFHANEEDLNRYYDVVTEAYKKIYQRLGIGDITYLTYASGGTFSKYSHEFQTVCEAGEDLIYICEKCHVAVNKEIIEEQNTCPLCGNKELVEKKAIEVGNIFKQRIKFTDAFNFNYTNETGELKAVEMGAYGIGPSRLMGTIVEIFCDDNGIIWPENIAPYQVHLLSLGKAVEINELAVKWYDTLSKNFEVLFDDREDVQAGEKFADSDLLGLPWRVVISPKSIAAGGAEVKRRGEATAQIVDFDKLINYLQS